ncbi:uncharacterized protein LOC143372044 isoform X2 [Andrena cerasifolii]|uniref:uncharacterized protein LOC143372044 isoform X2 n=1 Tax=Andrena cerasifolii TaxID=2819439 RepID=UPI0040382AF4
MIVSTILSSVTSFHRRHSNDAGRNAELTMDTEVRTLKQELVRTQEALKAATRRCRDLVKELDNRTASHESDRTLRDQQLSWILRALLGVEARLKQEQKSIRQLLCEKDNVIRNQQLEIARLRRYTKNYIKCKREQTLGQPSMKIETTTDIEKRDLHATNVEADSRQDSSLSKDIQKLKCEIIAKLSPSGVPAALQDRGVKKTHSFAGSDISKASLTSSENTDVSIITTTTEGSPSLLSTEGFCEGESTDVSPGSTLNKSNRCTPTMVTDSENETTMIFDGDNDEEAPMAMGSGPKVAKKKAGIGRSKTQKACKDADAIEATSIARTESKDDGMDCNFASEDEEKEQEPIYVNACNEANISRNLEHAEDNATTEVSKTSEDYSNNNSKDDDKNAVNNNDNSVPPRMEIEEQSIEETSGNWYSDPDEDRVNDDVFRHSTYRPNSNHNSVLECVNQILLRDMEEEESILSVPRRFKHRGRIVRFQPARLSDIESVGSEMERKNSEEAIVEKEVSSGEFNDIPPSSFEATATEDEFGMSLTQTASSSVTTKISSHESSLEEEPEESKAIPIVIIEPKVEVEETRVFPSSQTAQKTKASIGATNPPLKLERIEEKTCLQMSTKGLTIAKNLDYEDIESLPEIISPPPKTPPALPPKPQFKNNTLILKKIPSPSFLIDETRKKQPLLESSSSEHSKKILGFISSPLKSAGISLTSARSLNFDEAVNKAAGTNEEGNFWKNRFNNVRSSFQTRQGHETVGEQTRKLPRVTNIVRHFEEFKIGGYPEDQAKERNKTKEKHVHPEFDQEFDIRQNFEEFNLDECDLSDDPDRPEGDGSERLGNLRATVSQNEKTAATKDNNNVPLAATNSSSGYDHFLEATGLSNKSILTPSRLLSNHKSMLKPKDVKYKNKIKATAVLEKHGVSATNSTTHVRHWTGPFV